MAKVSKRRHYLVRGRATLVDNAPVDGTCELAERRVEALKLEFLEDLQWCATPKNTLATLNSSEQR